MLNSHRERSMKKNGPGLSRCFREAVEGSLGAVRTVWGILLIGFISAIIAIGGFSATMGATNTLDFCVSCHSMRDNVFSEYKQTAHYSNRTGVRVICSDCHVPKDWPHKIMRKIRAAKDVYGTIVGTVDTKEKFEAKRMEMANNDWNAMKASDSRECRNCHSFEAMKAGKQKPRAQERHAQAQQEGKTCIDCHKGIAHLLPKEYVSEDEE